MKIRKKIYGSYFHDYARMVFDDIVIEGADEVHEYINKNYLIEWLNQHQYSSLGDVYEMINNL